MSEYVAAYGNLVGLIAINAMLAYSQYVVLRAGVFSIATAGFAAIGAYVAALAVMRFELPAFVGAVAAVAAGTGFAVLIAVPLARLRGVFQAIATLAFVQIVLSFNQNATDITNGALGINGIPKAIDTSGLVVILAVTIYLLREIGRARIGRAFDAIRQDETVAVSLGVSVFRTHLFAFALSGALAGLGGALEAYHSYSITPEQFGFHLLVACLTFVILGGRVSVWGPLVGAAILTLLPEVARPFKEYRLLVHGAVLILSIIYLQHGIVDTLQMRWRTFRLARANRPVEGGIRGAPVA